MKVTHVNSNDLAGKRSHGYDLMRGLEEDGVSGHQLVLNKQSSYEKVESIAPTYLAELRGLLCDREYMLGVSNLLFPWGKKVLEHPLFQASDVVHYHSIHDHMISILDYKRLFSAKPSVWTIHDQWLGTGHCMYPFGCTGYLENCGNCAQLVEPRFSLSFQNSEENRKLKMHYVGEINPYIVVSTDYMVDFLKKSPITAHFDKVTKIPFGIDLEEFGQSETEISRKKWGIPEKDFVIGFRAVAAPYKGVSYIIEALRQIPEKNGITIVTVDHMALPLDLMEKFNVIELGNSTGTQVAEFFATLDLFLMPSLSESFGMMAIEAMASSVPVVVFKNTVLEEVTFSPICGIAVPYADSEALGRTIWEIKQNPEERKKRGKLGRELAEKYYTFSRYKGKHKELYEKIIASNPQSKCT